MARLLKGWRDTPAADLDAVLATLMAVSQLLAVTNQIWCVTNKKFPVSVESLFTHESESTSRQFGPMCDHYQRDLLLAIEFDQKVT